MADLAQVDLQREADEERTGPIKSDEACQRLESFKQGEIDRWGREVSFDTPIEDFYNEGSRLRPPALVRLAMDPS